MFFCCVRDSFKRGGKGSSGAQWEVAGFVGAERLRGAAPTHVCELALAHSHSLSEMCIVCSILYVCKNYTLYSRGWGWARSCSSDIANPQRGLQKLQFQAHSRHTRSAKCCIIIVGVHENDLDAHQMPGVHNECRSVPTLFYIISCALGLRRLTDNANQSTPTVHQRSQQLNILFPLTARGVDWHYLAHMHHQMIIKSSTHNSSTHCISL